MKMLKKAAAVLLAAAMSLVMLTACGGGSGSSSSLLAQTLGSKYTLKYTLVEQYGQEMPNGYSTTVMTDGTRFYEMNSDEDYASLTNAEGSYTLDLENKRALKSKEKDDTEEMMKSAMAVTESGTKEYKGKTYVTETATFDMNGGKVSMSYCFYNGKLEYMMQNVTSPAGKTYSWVYRVDNVAKSVDESLLDINNYTIVENENDFYSYKG